VKSLAAEIKDRGLVRSDNPNSSRHKGVRWAKKNKKWKAQVQRGGKREHLGYFATQAEAKACHDARCQELGISADAGKTWGYKSYWRTSIMVDGKKKFCGGFEATARGEVDAALAYDVAMRAAGRPEKANFKQVDVEPEAEGDDDDEELEGSSWEPMDSHAVGQLPPRSQHMDCFWEHHLL
jgi:hypothetical protein